MPSEEEKSKNFFFLQVQNTYKSSLHAPVILLSTEP